MLETPLATRWHKMRGWLWKADSEGETGIQRRQRARLGRVQMEVNHGDCYKPVVRGEKREREENKKTCGSVEKNMWK